MSAMGEGGAFGKNSFSDMLLDGVCYAETLISGLVTARITMQKYAQPDHDPESLHEKTDDELMIRRRYYRKRCSQDQMNSSLLGASTAQSLNEVPR